MHKNRIFFRFCHLWALGGKCHRHVIFRKDYPTRSLKVSKYLNRRHLYCWNNYFAQLFLSLHQTSNGIKNGNKYVGLQKTWIYYYWKIECKHLKTCKWIIKFHTIWYFGQNYTAEHNEMSSVDKTTLSWGKWKSI